ncbi:hypothetical protein GLW08_11760 [Pontibacillus yanchengensis]|uniref:Uncharacterized protein n=1 Tax=Pontibacillus yanchengensis TaxID=462910 RepID=A0ACC7VEZ1_9BACI|nr:flagellar protein FliT [Pontibacillus yanchengensis]MYL54013.1 hypothetical protein [Pontibacillus yanchengensis]
MSQVQELHELTSALYKLVHETPSSEERTEHIEKLNDLFDKREAYMENLERPTSDEEKALGKEILEMDRVIQDKVNHQMKDLKREMARLKKTKTSNQKYTNPYQQLSNYDGMFLDKKK